MERPGAPRSSRRLWSAYVAAGTVSPVTPARDASPRACLAADHAGRSGPLRVVLRPVRGGLYGAFLRFAESAERISGARAAFFSLLVSAGVRASKLDRCTYAEEGLFYSYRRTTHRNEADYGRQISAIALEDK